MAKTPPWYLHMHCVPPPFPVLSLYFLHIHIVIVILCIFRAPLSLFMLTQQHCLPSVVSDFSGWMIRHCAVLGLSRICHMCKHNTTTATKGSIGHEAMSLLMQGHSNEKDSRVLEAYKMTQVLCIYVHFVSSYCKCTVCVLHDVVALYTCTVCTCTCTCVYVLWCAGVSRCGWATIDH